MSLDTEQAVDSQGLPLKVGSIVSLVNCTVVGLKADVNNRLNLWLLPPNTAIVTNDPSNPLNGIGDKKAVLVSGYNCVRIRAKQGDPDDPAPAAAVAGSDAALPSNFLVPSST